MRRLPLYVMIFGTVAVLLAAILVFRGYFAGRPPVVAKAPAPVKIAGMAPVAPTAQIGIIKVQHDLDAGTLIQPGMLVKAMVPASAFRPGEEIWTTGNVNQFSGAMVRRAIMGQTPLTRAMVIEPGDHGFLSAVLKPGDEAMTVPVDAVTDSSGLVWPGDHVAVLLGRSSGKAQDADAGAISASTVVEDARVIATGGQIIHPADPKKQKDKVGTVTLEVTPRQAERIIVAEKLGSLALSLLSAEHPPPAAPPVWGYEVAAQQPLQQETGHKTVTVLSPTQAQGYAVP